MSESSSDDENIKKKRGRKPKTKVPENPSDTPKIVKKRGRKKKCEMNSETRQKISGYNVNSIDTKDNKIQFGEVLGQDSGENVSFGILNIKRHNIVKEPQNVDENTSFVNLCEIDLSIVVDIKPKKQKVIKKQDKKDLSNFFEGIPSENNMVNSNVNFNGNILSTKKKENPKKKENIHILKCYRGRETELPTKTDILCWWCCHGFDTIPRFMPTKYDEMRKRYKIAGNFCSWSCVKAFMVYDSTALIPKGIMLNTLIKAIHGSSYNISCAPPRSVLKVFGGNMTIEQFRNIDKNEYFEIHTNKMYYDENYNVSKEFKL